MMQGDRKLLDYTWGVATACAWRAGGSVGWMPAGHGAEERAQETDALFVSNERGVTEDKRDHQRVTASHAGLGVKQA